MNSSLLLNNNLYFCKVLLIKDHLNKSSLKFSFKKKFYSIKITGEQNTLDGEYNLDDVKLTKEIPQGSSLEISYKFSDRKLEIKNETKIGSIERTFYEVKIPAESPLIFFSQKNVYKLDRVEPQKEDIVFRELKNEDGTICENLAINISFEGKNGKPWVDHSILKGDKQRRILLFPNIKPQRLYITVGCYNPPKGGKTDLSMWVPPHKIIKTT